MIPFNNKWREDPNLNYWFLIVTCYFFIYAILLYLSDFLPYVLDNNETYSSLVHAYNMYFGDWGTHFGLADEAFNPDPDAHPVIHTHQGNWPRIFAYVLFAFGARTPESQIITHIFTVGVLAVWLMHRFFINISNKTFALITCLVFITDYMLFVQWHFVTYRVWHCLFVFSSLNCVKEIDGNSKAWKFFFVINFAALFYWELVFAFFVSLWAILYYSYLCSWNTRLILKRGLLMAASGMLSLLVLFVQLCMYMGIKNTILDYSYTFMSRNFYDNNVELAKKMVSFYNDLGVVFWINSYEGGGFRSLNNLISNFFTWGFQIHTPVFSLQAIICFISLLSSIIVSKLSEAQLTWKIASISLTRSKQITVISVWILLVCIYFDNCLSGLSMHQEFYEYGSLYCILALPILSWIIASAIFDRRYSINLNIKTIDLIVVNIFILDCSYLIRVLPKYYDQFYNPIWHKYLSAAIPIEIWRLTTVATILCCSANIITSKSYLKENFKNYAIIWYILTGLCAYAFVCLLAPGYILSGYLMRLAPFTVFLIDVIISLLIWYMVENVITHIRLSKLNFRSNVLMLILTITIMLIVSYHWFNIQYLYYKIFPPTQISFIKDLRGEELNQKSIVTNQYSLPFAYESNYWAYKGFSVAAGELILTKTGFQVSNDAEYVWYKNYKTFEAYKYPDYYVCFAPNTLVSVANKLRRDADYTRNCSGNRVVSQALLSPGFVADDLRLRHKIISSDSNNDSWAVVKLDWEFPPYLDKFQQNNKYFIVKYNKRDNTLNIRYNFVQQAGAKERLTRFKIVYHSPDHSKLVLDEFSAVNNRAIMKLSSSPAGIIEIYAVPISFSKTGMHIRETINIARL